MNVAIEITCLLIEVVEEGIKLKMDGNRLKVTTGADIDTQLRSRLRTHEAAIVERLRREVDHEDPFKGFINERCLFYAGEGMAVPIAELDETYRQWAQDHNQTPGSLVQLHERLRRIGCEETLYNTAPWWEHLGLTLKMDTETVMKRTERLVYRGYPSPPILSLVTTQVMTI